MPPSYRTIALVFYLLFPFSMVYAKGKVAQPFTIQMDVDSVSIPVSKMAYGFRFYTQLPVTKAFQTHNPISLKSNGAHRKRKGKAVLPIL